MNIVSLFAKLRALGVLVKADVQGKYFNIEDTANYTGERVPVVSAGGLVGARSAALSAGPNTLVLRGSRGIVSVGDATAGSHAVNFSQLNSRFSAESRAAIDALDPATATLEELITALQTPAAPAALNMIVEEDEML